MVLCLEKKKIEVNYPLTPQQGITSGSRLIFILSLSFYHVCPFWVSKYNCASASVKFYAKDSATDVKINFLITKELYW